MKTLLTCAALAALAAGPALAQVPVKVVKAEDVTWKGHPLFQGAQISTIVGDPSKADTVVQRFKFPPNFKVAPHTHLYTEVATVLSGTLQLGLGETFDAGKGQTLKPGSVFALKAGDPHYVWTTGEEVIVQIVFTGPSGMTFMNPADDPRKK